MKEGMYLRESIVKGDRGLLMVAAVTCALTIVGSAAAGDAAGCRMEFQPEIQAAVERTLNATVEKFNGRGGWAVVQEVRTGRILAMAAQSNAVDNAVNTAYEPGSLQKAFTLAAALNERLVTPDTLIDAGDGSWEFEGKTLSDHVTGVISVRNAIIKSSNIALAKTGLMVGPKRLAAYFNGFGFGRKLDCGDPNEASGTVELSKEYSSLETSRVGIGEGMTVTAIQMVNAYSCIANEGMLMRPYFGSDGKPEVIGRPITPEVAGRMRVLLNLATEEGGTGQRARIGGYSVAGLTGTAQKSVKGGYSDTDFYASFAGFVPADRPIFCIIVTIDAPKQQHAGGYVAAPAFAEIAATAARVLKVPPESGR